MLCQVFFYIHFSLFCFRILTTAKSGPKYALNTMLRSPTNRGNTNRIITEISCKTHIDIERKLQYNICVYYSTQKGRVSNEVRRYRYSERQMFHS